MKKDYVYFIVLHFRYQSSTSTTLNLPFINKVTLNNIDLHKSKYFQFSVTLLSNTFKYRPQVDQKDSNLPMLIAFEQINQAFEAGQH